MTSETIQSQVDQKLAKTVAEIKELVLAQVLELEHSGELPNIAIGTKTSGEWGSILEVTHIPGIVVHDGGHHNQSIVLTSENLFSAPGLFVSKFVPQPDTTSPSPWCLPSWQNSYSRPALWLTWGIKAAAEVDARMKFVNAQ